MPIDKPKRPDRYPLSYHDAVRAAAGTRSVWFDVLTFDKPEEVRSAQRKFRAFLKGLQTYPLHPTSQIAKDLAVRSRAQITGRGWVLQIRADFPLDLSPLSKVIEKSY